ncbi:MAG: DUF1080 domain-containing protein [Gammaproteobacteria bacterium]|nr:DUF1080 domain-containing protein [Gammaproteobacteria bacterium]
MSDEIRVLPKGYSDTPVIPGQSWRVHDVDRPMPAVVEPSSDATKALVGAPPSDAHVLFDGTNTDGWTHRNGESCGWTLVEGGAMEVTPRTGDIRSKAEFGTCQLHVEWRAPTEIYADSQGRGNSGVFLLGLYEIQVLDGYENPTYADGVTAAIYGQYPPLVNACVPPGMWHSFDVVFETPEYENGALAKPAAMTVFHNGVLVHLRQQMQGPTQHRALASYAEPHGPKGPLVLQDHGDKVQFRNIWVRELDKLQAD